MSPAMNVVPTMKATRYAVMRAAMLGILSVVGSKPMRFAIVGSGAVGGYFGAKLARHGQDVTFIARGAHLAAIRERGLQVKSAKLGDFVVHAPAEDDATKVG